MKAQDRYSCYIFFLFYIFDLPALWGDIQCLGNFLSYFFWLVWMFLCLHTVFFFYKLTNQKWDLADARVFNLI